MCTIYSLLDFVDAGFLSLIFVTEELLKCDEASEGCFQVMRNGKMKDPTDVDGHDTM